MRAASVPAMACIRRYRRFLAQGSLARSHPEFLPGRRATPRVVSQWNVVDSVSLAMVLDHANKCRVPDESLAFYKVPPAGVEPATLSLEGTRSIH